MDVLKINGKEVVLNTNLTIKELKEICDYCEIKYYGNKIMEHTDVPNDENTRTSYFHRLVHQCVFRGFFNIQDSFQ
jgi:hypothetical protein